MKVRVSTKAKPFFQQNYKGLKSKLCTKRRSTRKERKSVEKYCETLVAECWICKRRVITKQCDAAAIIRGKVETRLFVLLQLSPFSIKGT